MNAFLGAYHPFIAPPHGLNTTRIVCEGYPEVLGDRQGYYYFLPCDPGIKEFAWVQRRHVWIAYRYISSPEQSTDTAWISAGTEEEVRQAAANYHAQTGALTGTRDFWEDESVSMPAAIEIVRGWHAEAEEAYANAKAAWEALPAGDVEAATEEVLELVTRLRRNGIAITLPEVGPSSAKRDAMKHLNWCNDRRRVWKAILEDPSRTNLIQALKIWCDPAYDVLALCSSLVNRAKRLEAQG